MKISRQSMISGEVRTKELDVTQEQLDLYYKSDILIQDAFPHLSPGDREFIKTGIVDEEWEEMASDNS